MWVTLDTGNDSESNYSATLMTVVLIHLEDSILHHSFKFTLKPSNQLNIKFLLLLRN